MAQETINAVTGKSTQVGAIWKLVAYKELDAGSIPTVDTNILQ
jgi:hypothetical protein